nr:DNA (cytosine-5-)-methyltransferase [Phascolarctobacterium sp.]
MGDNNYGNYDRKNHLRNFVHHDILGENRYKNIPRGADMTKQIHLRLEDNQYKEVAEYAKMNGMTVQDSISTALYIMLSKQKKKKYKANFTFIDLFAGIGGMRLAFEEAGGECVYSNEWNKFSQQTYMANFGDMPDGDITQVNADDIPDHDVLVAGFPCQPFSIAGVSKKNSLGRATGFADKTQGTLFFDVCRILEAKRPKAFMLENVKNLCSHDKGKTFKVITESLNELGYEVFYKVIDGQAFVPQHRERIIIVGFDRERYGSFFDFEFNIIPKEPKPVIADILEKEVSEKYTLSDKLWIYLQNYAAKHKAAGNGFGYGIAPLDGVSRTLSARYYKDGSEVLIEQDGKNPRKLTPRECARLQGFPDTFAIPVSDTQAYRQFGNSVVVPLMAAVAKLIINKINELEISNRLNGYREVV